MSYIARYSANNAATYNTALQTLEERIRPQLNAMEPVASGTITATQTLIDISLGSFQWAWLSLRIYLVMQEVSGGNSATLRLYANNNTFSNPDESGSSYYSADFFALQTSGLGVGQSFVSSGVYCGLTDDINPTLFEMTIWPNASGFAVIGGSSGLLNSPGGQFIERFAGYYNGTRPTSLQLGTAFGGTVGAIAAGTMYRLEGVRA